MNGCRIAGNNFKRSYNKRLSFIINLIIPVIVVGLGIFVNSISKPNFTIGIIQANPSDAVVERLANTEGITVAKANPNTIQIDLITGKYSAVIDGSTPDYKLSSIKNAKTNRQLEQIIDGYQLAATPIRISEVVGTPMSVAERTVSFTALFLMITATVTASMMIKDKNSGTLKRYQYSPQSTASYIAGNFIYNYLITFLQFFIAVTFMQIIRIETGIRYSNFILMGLWLSGIATAFGTLVASLFREEMYANLFASCIALFGSLIGGTFIPYDNMPDLLQKISVISPLRWFIEITGKMENGLNWFQNMPQIAVLSGMILVYLLLAASINKKQIEFR